MPEKWITVAEAAARLKIPARSLRNWIASGHVPASAVYVVTVRLMLVNAEVVCKLTRPARGNPNLRKSKLRN